jgi:hypothetical protein
MDGKGRGRRRGKRGAIFRGRRKEMRKEGDRF